MLTVQHLYMKYGEASILKDISFELEEGSCLGIIGPNGVGKSTLLKIISGIMKPSQGKVLFNDNDLFKISQKKLAQKMAVLSQDGLPQYPISVIDTVMMGRYPHLRWYEREGKKDIDKVERVMHETDIVHLQDKMLDTLSGGERQRVAIAKAMVQEPELLLLDEPTTYLDIHHQLNVLKLVKKWQKEDNLTIIMVLHDLNLASQFCDQLLLLHDGQVERMGSNEDVIRQECISKVYKTEPEIIQHPKLKVPQVLLVGMDN